MPSLTQPICKIAALVGLTILLSPGCTMVDKLLPSKYDADAKARCEQLGGKMAVGQDRHGDYVYCGFPDNSHCAESVVRSANCIPGKWPLPPNLRQ